MTTSPPFPSDLELYQYAERLLDVLLSSADVERIGVTRWWGRAKTALETGAATSTSFRQAVAKAAKKLQIDTLNERASTTTADLQAVLDDPAVFARWRTLCVRDALVIAANVRAQRVAERESK